MFINKTGKIEMVCFTQHLYAFDYSERTKWFPLIDKYLHGCRVTVSFLNEQDVIEFSHRCNATLEVLNRVSGMGDITNVKKVSILTDRIWDGISFFKALPTVSSEKLESLYEGVDLDTEVRDRISEALKDRAGCAHDILIQRKYEIPPEKVLAYAAYALNNLNLPSKEYKIYYCRSVSRAYAVVNEFSVCEIGTNRAGDMEGSIILDLNDGFVEGVFGADIPKEFNDDFNEWVSGGHKLDQPILKFAP